jgi:hypothetical protein
MAITLEVSACHITLPDLFNRWSSAFYLNTLPGLRLNIQQLQIELERTKP